MTLKKASFYIQRCAGKGKKSAEIRKGYTFEVDGIQLGAHREYGRGSWIITHIESGVALGGKFSYKTLNDLKAAEDEIREFIPKLKEYTEAEDFKKMIENFKRLCKEAEEAAENTTNENKEEKTMAKTKYFTGIKTLEELRNKYRDLLKTNHPDNGGSTEAMQEINAQYDEAFKLLKSGANLEDEKAAMKWNEAEDAAIREALYKIIHLENINIEVVGCWIWVDGDTYASRETLKASGYTWSKARKKWHFAPYEKKFYKGSKKSFDQIRREYGSTEVKNEKQEKITA